MALTDAWQLAKKLNVSVGTIRNWTRSRTLPQIRVSAKIVRYDPAVVLRALDVPKSGGVK